MRRSSACSAAVVTAKAENLPATSEGGALTVYFDGSCPLCAREIAFYRRRCAGAAANWVDVSYESPAALGAGLTRDRALERFHVRRADGTLCSGADAFTELWAEVPGMAWLGRLGRNPIVGWVLQLCYSVFLPLRPFLVRAFPVERRIR